jgi:hypothetical protein
MKAAAVWPGWQAARDFSRILKASNPLAKMLALRLLLH